jgi:hypothetical protein
MGRTVPSWWTEGWVGLHGASGGKRSVLADPGWEGEMVGGCKKAPLRATC